MMSRKRVALVFCLDSGWHWSDADAPEIGRGPFESRGPCERSAEDRGYEIETAETIARDLRKGGPMIAGERLTSRERERDFWLEWAARAQKEIAALLADTIGHDAHQHAPSIGEAVDLAIAIESQLAALLGLKC